MSLRSGAELLALFVLQEVKSGETVMRGGVYKIKFKVESVLLAEVIETVSEGKPINKSNLQ
jgi:hypothetical protein